MLRRARYESQDIMIKIVRTLTNRRDVNDSFKWAASARGDKLRTICKTDAQMTTHHDISRSTQSHNRFRVTVE